jgi:hypothetical protein
MSFSPKGYDVPGQLEDGAAPVSFLLVPDGVIAETTEEIPAGDQPEAEPAGAPPRASKPAAPRLSRKERIAGAWLEVERTIEDMHTKTVQSGGSFVGQIGEFLHIVAFSEKGRAEAARAAQRLAREMSVLEELKIPITDRAQVPATHAPLTHPKKPSRGFNRQKHAPYKICTRTPQRCQIAGCAQQLAEILQKALAMPRAEVEETLPPAKQLTMASPHFRRKIDRLGRRGMLAFRRILTAWRHDVRDRSGRRH